MEPLEILRFLALEMPRDGEATPFRGVNEKKKLRIIGFDEMWQLEGRNGWLAKKERIEPRMVADRHVWKRWSII